ncbi:MAG TPA: T9SS type A sorting domain-containing protein [Flavobacterium sp.]|nr:T9SS type A sorting domain-containing protein [Flavobacterium sp.]
MGVVPTCWGNIILGGASQIISNTEPASGTSQIYQFGFGEDKISIVVLPLFSNINAGTHQFRFKVKTNGGTGELEFGYITDITDASTFVVIEELTISNNSYDSVDAERVIAVPTSVPSTARLAVRNPGTTWAGIYWDDVYWEPISQNSVESVIVTTQENISTEITAEDTTLQLVATITPDDANQNVVWSVEEGLDVVSVDENGLVTANENEIATVRATSTEDDTVFDEIEITVNYENSSDELCEAVDTFLETFEDFTAFPENCWSSDKSAPYADIDTHNDSQVFRFYSFFDASGAIYLVSPEVTTIDGNHVLSFDVAGVEDNALTTTFQVGTLSDNTDFSTFIPAEEAFNPESGTTHTSVPVPANSGHKYVAIKFTPDAMHQAVFVDNIEWKIAASSDKFDKNLVSLYPNPTYDFIHINTELSISNIEVYNNLGQRIFVTNYFNDAIDLSNYPAGIYLVRLQTVDGEMAEYKVIKK